MKPPPDQAQQTDRPRAIQPVDATDLAGFQKSRAAENAARLEGDKILLHNLMLAAYAGPEWRRFSVVLAEYGMGVMTSWIRKGNIFEQCKKKKLGLGGLLARDADDVHDLATETVATAINVFRDKVLIPRVWDPNKGAGLMTFFIGQCVFQFPNIYRRWRTEKLKRLSASPELVARELEHRRNELASTETLVELSRQVDQLGPKNPQTAEAMIEMGFSVTEVAKEFEVSERALESKLYRHRRSGS